MTTITTTDHGKKPWYKQPAPWLLMAGPFVVVVAAIYTAWLAIQSADGLVADDYYKQGLNIDRTIALSERAQALGLRAGIGFDAAGIAVHLSGRDRSFVLPNALVVTLSHPTRAGMDQAGKAMLLGTEYRGEFRIPRSGHWIIQIEDGDKTWRLVGNIVLPSQGLATIGSTPDQ